MSTKRTARRMALAAAIAVALSPAAQAATFTVSNTADSGAGSLREAIEAANAAPGADVVAFDAGFGSALQVVALATPLRITDALTLDGPGADFLALDGGSDHRVLEIDPSLPGTPVTLEGVTVRNGFSGSAEGGCIMARGTRLALQDSVFSGCIVGEGPGGALSLTGGGLPPLKGVAGPNASLHVTNSRFSGNQADGGGALVVEIDGGGVTIEDSVFEDNHGDYYAGAAELLVFGGDIVLQDTVLSGNTAGGPGGALIAYGYGNTTLRDTEFTGNRALVDSQYGNYAYGGGAMLLMEGDVLVTGSTFDDNALLTPDVPPSKGAVPSRPAGVGGGLFTLPAFSGDTLRIEATQFTNNAAALGGGAAIGEPNIAARLSNAAARHGKRRQPKALAGDNLIVETRFAQNSAGFGGNALVLLQLSGSGPEQKAVSPGLTLDRVTMIGNQTASGESFLLPVALAIIGDAWPVQVLNSTITGNSGGIVTGFPFPAGADEPMLILDHSNVTDNPLGGVMAQPMAARPAGLPPQLDRYFRAARKDYPLPQVQIAIRNSVLHGASEGVDLSADPASVTLLHSLVGTTSPGDFSGHDDQGGNQFGADPLLGAPALAGHPFLEVQLPQDGSPLIDAGDPDVAAATPPATDQRGAPRIAGAAIDIGAVEVEPVPGIIAFDPAALTVAETAGTATFTAVRSDGDDGAVSVTFQTGDGTAAAGEDYTAASGTLSWADGESGAKTFSVAIADDALVESDETFTATLSAPTGNATLGTATATATITSDDLPPVGTLALSVTAVSVNETAGTVTLSVARSGGSFGAVGVSYATANGSATAGSDYTATAGTLSWADGDTAPKNIVVPILDDALVESPETFTLTLSDPSGGATLGASSATVTVVSNDNPPAGALAISPGALTANEAAGTATLTVSRSGGSFGTVSVNYASANGTALAGSDYTASSGTLTWADGDTAARSIVVPILDDALVEADEQFSLALSQPGGGASLGAGTATITIVSNDQAPTGVLQFDGAGNGGTVVWRFNEDGTPAAPAAQAKAVVQVAVTRSGGSAGAASIDFATQDGTAVAPGDYTATAGTLSWADGETGTRFINVNLVEDGVAEPEETFRIVLSNAQGAGIGLNAQAQIVIAANGTVVGFSEPITIPAGDLRGWLALFGALLVAGWAGLRRRL